MQKARQLQEKDVFEEIIKLRENVVSTQEGNGMINIEDYAPKRPSSSVGLQRRKTRVLISEDADEQKAFTQE